MALTSKRAEPTQLTPYEDDEHDVLPPMSQTIQTDVPRRQPRRMSSDVWDILQEFLKDGGLFDFAEHIASIAEQEQKVRNAPDDKMPVGRKAELVVRLAQAQANVKFQHLKVMETRRRYLTLEEFALLIDKLTEILHRRIRDPELVASIGLEIGTTLQMTMARIRSSG